VVFGEQVEGAIAHGWLDNVYQGLEEKGYAVGAAILPACSVGQPHRRNRLWFVGNSQHNGLFVAEKQSGDGKAILSSKEGTNCASKSEGAGGVCIMADTQRLGQQGQGQMGESLRSETNKEWQTDKPFDDSAGVQWLKCPDGKSRPVEPSIRLLAHGIPARVGRLRAYGNAIVPQVAAQFIKACEGVIA
jgi:DNA (cytosine-5)-methyltransferase 1